MAALFNYLYVMFAMYVTMGTSSPVNADKDEGHLPSQEKGERKHQRVIRQAPQMSAGNFMWTLYEAIDNSGRHSDDHFHLSIAQMSELGLDPTKLKMANKIVALENDVKKILALGYQRDTTFIFEMPSGKKITGAELRLFKQVSPVHRTGVFSIHLYVIRQVQSSGNHILDPVSSFDVEWSIEGWLILDITRFITSYLNMELSIKVMDTHGRLYDAYDIGLVGTEGSAYRQSFLVVYMFD